VRIHPSLWKAAFFSALVLVAAISVSGQQAESATNQTQSAHKAIQVNYRGRSGTIFANGEHAFLYLEGESKSWEIVQVRKNDDNKFTLQGNDAIFMTVTQAS
jgi:hypothetical protein